MYEFRRGEGWVPQTYLHVAEKVYDGKRYRIYVTNRTALRGDRALAYVINNDLEEAVRVTSWFEDWVVDGVNVPAGFGPCVQESVNRYKIITELIS